jgi:hypothetical protein
LREVLFPDAKAGTPLHPKLQDAFVLVPTMVIEKEAVRNVETMFRFVRLVLLHQFKQHDS